MQMPSLYASLESTTGALHPVSSLMLLHNHFCCTLPTNSWPVHYTQYNRPVLQLPGSLQQVLNPVNSSHHASLVRKPQGHESLVPLPQAQMCPRNWQWQWQWQSLVEAGSMGDSWHSQAMCTTWVQADVSENSAATQ